MKFALVDPGGTTTTGWLRTTEELLLVSTTAAPPAGAADHRNTVHVLTPADPTVVGEQTRLATAGGCTVRRNDWVVVPEVAEIVAVCTLVTAVVVTVNVMAVRPIGIVTCAGAIA